MLGAGDQARNGVKYTLTFQQKDGRFEILKGYHKENGIVIWTCLRHAQLTQDKQWLRSVWPTIEKAMNYIAVLRDQSLRNEETMDDGLMPPGFPDGGLGPRYCYEYTNTYWNLAGVRAAVQAAEWLGKNDQASQWRMMFDDLYASFYGHAWLWQGDGRKAAETLYAFANHAAPILAWREEQSPKGETYKKVGDMPHNWASAEFIRLAVHLIALDRGNQLHLFEGLPTEWTRPGMVTRLNGIATPFGPLTTELTIADDGKSAQFQVDSLTDPSCNKVIVHLGGWASSNENATIELNPRQANRRRIEMERETD
jgi:hypothetical protein